MCQNGMLAGDFAYNATYLEKLYEDYLADSEHMDPTWQKVFTELEQSEHTPSVCSSVDERIFKLVEAYRTYGHLAARINPIAVDPAAEPWQLALRRFGLSSQEMDVQVPTLGLLDRELAPLGELIEMLKHIYCGEVSVEYPVSLRADVREWLQECFEKCHRQKNLLDVESKLLVADYLDRAELFENFLHTKYVGQKRFSLEGAETLIPMMAFAIMTGAGLGMRELVLGMAHRGRLNIMATILNKSYEAIFNEFDDRVIDTIQKGSGDVKYHKGYRAEVVTPQGYKVKVELVNNPSHLESVDAVVEGVVRAKQTLSSAENKQQQVLPILIHGDAAIAGQGVVYETLQLAYLAGYTTGGTVHIVVNNQIGFTTLPQQGRSTHYCTAIAHAFGIPVLHVNAEDPEGCVWAINLAVELRQRFCCDVMIDLNCYRKYGHNEGDEPAYTQPLEYQRIRAKKSIRELYRQHLVKEGFLKVENAQKQEEQFTASLHTALTISRDKQQTLPIDDSNTVLEPVLFSDTTVAIERLQQLAAKLCQWPSDFNIHHKLEQLYRQRLQMCQDDSSLLDWGMAEIIAYASLLVEGYSVRLAGQDVQRGTFSHRHAVFVDQKEEQHTYCPMQHLSPQQASFEIVNSPLSEYAALAFEYGYSLGAPQALVIWEAQFGDFINGAQIVIDQFIASAEQKWGQVGPVTLLLPHGYEGQGPEHSSGRMERFLALSADFNWRIASPTLPAQFFHLLRLQVREAVRKPLIVFTPKGLLRHSQCVSSLKTLSEGHFQTVLDDPNSPQQCRCLAFCNGRIYYDLIAERQARGDQELAIVRIEQLYPLDSQAIQEILQRYTEVTRYCWVQDEPMNMGAWSFIQPLLGPLLPSGKYLEYIGRLPSSAVATGSHALHKQQQQCILTALFA